ncbi:MAG: tetratricopeptide repeat protein [Planctomyces sp.]|nr:tetratricopeptide repeat protein [Planctomyces sp.]
MPRFSAAVGAFALLLSASGAAFAEQTSPPAPNPAETTDLPAPVLRIGDDLFLPFQPAEPLADKERLRGESLAWFMTAQVLLSRGETEQAVAALKKAVANEPDSLVPYRALVPALLESGDTDAAKQTALEGARRRPDGIVLVQGVALFLARTNRIEDGIGLLKQGLELLPEDSTFARRLPVLKQLGTFERVANRPREAAQHYRIVFEYLKAPDDRTTEDQRKELVGDPGVTYEEFGQVFLLAEDPDLALDAFNEAAKFRTARPGLHSFNLATLFRQTGKPDKALEELDKYFVAQLQTRGRAAYQLLKDLLTELNRGSELLPRLEQLASADPQNASLAFFLGDEYLAADRLDEAKQAYLKAPGGARDPRALIGLISIARQKKQGEDLFNHVIQAYQAIPVPKEDQSLPAAVDPEVRDLSSRFVLELKTLTDSQEAMDLFVGHAHTLRNAEPPKLEFVQAYICGKLSVDAKRTDDASAFYRLAITMQNQPSFQLYQELSSHLMDQDRHGDAVKLLDEALQNPALDDQRWMYQALQSAAYEMSGETDKALELIRAARQAQPQNSFLHYREGWINYHAQRWTEAIRVFEEVIAGAERDGTDSDLINTSRFSLSAIYVHLEEFDKGEKILEDVLKKEPENTQANNDLGYLWADRNKNLEQAHEMISKALAAEPENAAYLDSMGWVLYRLERYDEARAHLEKATTYDRGNDTTIWDHLGDVLEKLGQHDEALDAWVKAAELEQKKTRQDEKLLKSVLDKLPEDRRPVAAPAADSGKVE